MNLIKIILVILFPVFQIAGAQDTVPYVIVTIVDGNIVTRPSVVDDAFINFKLFVYADKGDVSQIQRKITEGANVNAKFNNGDTPITWAAKKGRTEAVKELIKYGANVNNVSRDGTTPLMIAAEMEHIETGEVLILNGADISKTNDDGYSALHISVLNNNFYFTDMLLYYEVPVDQKTKNGATALTMACFNGDSAMVKLLLIESGANPNHSANDGFTPLMAASQEGHEEIVKILLENGAIPDLRDKNRLSALCFAVTKGHKKVAKILIDHGADYNAVYGNGFNLMYLAEKYHQHDMKNYLKTLGMETQTTRYFDKMYLGTGLNVSNHDALSLFEIGLVEPRYDFSVGLVFMNRIGKATIVEVDEVFVNQLKEKRSYFGFSISKEFKLYEETRTVNMGIVADCKGLFTYGKYEAMEKNPRGHFVVSPSIGMYYRKDRFVMDLQYQYLNAGIVEFPTKRLVMTMRFDITFKNYIKDKTFY